MLVAIAFWALILSSGLLIWINGSRSARQFLGLILLASLATAAIELCQIFPFKEYLYFFIDTFLLIAALKYVLKESVFWPVWFAGFQLISVTSDLTRLILSGPIPSGPIPELYEDLAGFWAAPALVTMAIGTFRDRRQRQKL
jgi:hypothetical protein